MHRSQKVETTAEGFRRVLEPLAGRCEAVYEVGPMAQWVRPYAVKVTVANPSRIRWLFREGRPLTTQRLWKPRAKQAAATFRP